MKERKLIHNGREKWVVQHTVNGRRQRRFFPSRNAARQWITLETNKARRLGAATAQIVTDDFARMAADCAKRLEPYRKTLEDAVDTLIARLEAEGASKTLADLVEQFLIAKARDGKRPRYLADLRSRTGALVDHFGPARKIATIRTADIDGWLSSLEVGGTTRNNYRRAAAVFFGWCERRQFIPENPVSKVEVASVELDLPGIFTAAQMQTMLAKAEGDPQMTAWLAIGAYAGLRPSEVAALRWEDIHLADGVIDLTARKGSARARRRFVDILPILHAILEPIAQIAGPVVPDGFEQGDKLSDFRRDLPFEWPHNGLRHSFGTYHFQAFEDAGKTSVQMGHGGNPAMLLQRYRRPGIRRETARAFFGVTGEETAEKEGVL